MISIFDFVWHLTRIQDLLLSMVLEPKFTYKILDMILEYNLGVLDSLPPSIDGVRFIEDWGDQKGLMIGLKNWRNFLKQRLKDMYNLCKKKGCAVFIHSCGNITELFPDIIEMGVDVVDPIQPEVMDLEFIKKEYGENIVLFEEVG